MKRHYLSVFKWTWINNDAEKKFITDIKSVNCSECKPLWQFKKSNGTSIFSDYTPHSLFGPCDFWGGIIDPTSQPRMTSPTTHRHNLACVAEQAFIATLVFDPSMSALPIFGKQNSPRLVVPSPSREDSSNKKKNIEKQFTSNSNLVIDISFLLKISCFNINEKKYLAKKSTMKIFSTIVS